MATVLVLDRDPLQVELTSVLLRRERHRAVTTTEPETAFAMLEDSDIDLVVVEPSSTRHDGFRLCQQIRRMRQDVPILIVSEMSGEAEVVRGLLSGADDYLTKPFGPHEFLARIQALLRRAAAGRVVPGVPVLAIGSIALNLHRAQVAVGGRPVHVTPRELAVLHVLMTNPNRVLTRDQLIELAWHDFTGSAKAVDVCIQRVRSKLEALPGGAGYIVAVRGLGYRFEKPRPGPGPVLKAKIVTTSLSASAAS